MANPSTTPSHIARGKSADATDLIIRRRHRLAQGFLPRRGGTLLDFGCGTGAQTILFANDFDRIIGVDVEEPSIRTFRRRIEELGLTEKIQALHYDGRTLPIPDRSIDFAVSFEVLEHVDDERRALDELRRVLKPGGRLAMSVPNKWWVFETHGAALPLLKWNRVPFFSWLPKPLHDRWARARIYTRGEITGKLRAAGFDVLESGYITAPMDVVKDPRLQTILRRIVFRGDRTRVPFLSTAVLVVASPSR